MAQTQSGRSGRLIKNIVMLAIIAGAAVFVGLQVKKRNLIERENAAIELQNEGSYQEAVDAYEALATDLKSKKDRERVDRAIAACYVAMAEAPELSYTEAMALYRKAYEHDPDSIGNPAILKALESSK